MYYKILQNFLFFFLKLLISSLQKERFLSRFIFLYFEAIYSYIVHKKLSKKFKSSSNDFYVYLSIFMFMTWLFLIIDNHCSYRDYSHYLCKWLFMIINNHLWLLIIICNYKMIIYDYWWLFAIINNYLWLRNDCLRLFMIICSYLRLLFIIWGYFIIIH